MAIYGTALLALALLVGLAAGTAFGRLAGVDADIGGVGLAMLLLVVGTDWLHRTGRMKPATETGIAYWSALYIPIVVAMAASQNVLAAFEGGVAALLAGAVGVVICFALVGLLAHTGRADADKQEGE